MSGQKHFRQKLGMATFKVSALLGESAESFSAEATESTGILMNSIQCMFVFIWIKKITF